MAANTIRSRAVVDHPVDRDGHLYLGRRDRVRSATPLTPPDMLVHLDGARIANVGGDRFGPADDGLRHRVDPHDPRSDQGRGHVGETVVFVAATRDGTAGCAGAVRAQAGRSARPQSRFVAAQVLALLEDDLWLANARHANLMAARLAWSVEAIPGSDSPTSRR